jgi:THO complex subunit 2
LIPAEVFKQLALIGPYIHADVVLFTRVTRCIRQHIVAAAATNDAEAQKSGEDVLGACVLPALALIAANPAAVNPKS